jgi:3',5'-nucleoside bisphosphate phosphatase
MKLPFLFFLSALSVSLFAQTPHRHIADRAIDFPDVPGYLTLKADLHMHSVFSDGDVWPSVRVQEAQRDSLDVISLTEHLEYLPHKNDIPYPDRNRAHELALKSANGSGLIVIKGSEITRSMPPGHSNAIFIKDANKLVMDDSVAVFEEAHNQGAFIFWNHPNWIAQYTNGVAKLTKMHEKLIQQGYLNGIEVVNELTYSEEALQIALDHNLTIIGTSDVHGLIDWLYEVPEGGHRPVTLIFAKEKTEAAMKEALFARRTAVWFNNTLIGREEMLTPLIRSSISVLADAEYLQTWRGDTEVLKVELKNNSDASFLLYNKSEYNFHTNDDVIMLEPHSVTSLEVKTITAQKKIELKFTILNAVTAPDTHPEMIWQVSVKEKKDL